MAKKSLLQGQRGMDSENLNLGSSKSRIDDIRWLCSLNESELDFLISLKVMILRGAKKIGSQAIGKNFDLKYLRALSFILMNKLKGHLEVMPGSIGPLSSSLDNCKLLKFDIDPSFEDLSIEELDTYICSEKRNRVFSVLFGDMPPSQKPRTES
ncbi:unnamed protein product [Cuscuta epithymum]|uniref:Uncharacterized protein n=1 Tax=Cuscuta epithymum TaxID=186058 RepID=A0AAV0F5Z0_9ASTE|nr:unnamed protein product [Cuscuta epithymum]